MDKQVNQTILDLFDPFSHKQEFSKKIQLSVLRNYDPSTSCRI